MTIDDDQANWNKENIPLDVGKETATSQLASNGSIVVHGIKREATRRVFAELTLEDSDDDSDDQDDQPEDAEEEQELRPGSCDSDREEEPHPIVLPLPVTSRHNDAKDQAYLAKHFHKNTGMGKSLLYGSAFRNPRSTGHSTKLHTLFGGCQNEKIKKESVPGELTKLRSVDETSSEESESELDGSVSSDDDTSCEAFYPLHVPSRWNKLKKRYLRKPKYRNLDFDSYGTGSSEADGCGSRNGEDFEEFITPPLTSIPGFELEEHGHSGEEEIMPSTSSFLPEHANSKEEMQTPTKKTRIFWDNNFGCQTSSV